MLPLAPFWGLPAALAPPHFDALSLAFALRLKNEL